MNKLTQFYGTAVGKKFVVAVTGIMMAGFLVMHMIGNLKAFAGETKLDDYALYLRDIGQDMFGHETVLWIARIGLVVAVVAHIFTIVLLVKQNHKARPVKYHVKKSFVSTFPARMMRVSGLLLLIFIIVHIAQFTFGEWLSTPFEEGKVYSNISHAFGSGWLPWFYVFMMFIVCIHLCHGLWSFFQTLGIDNPDRNKLLRGLAIVVSLLLFIGFSAVPVAFATGLIGVAK
ncbi:MAG: succinate dehydrogenase cytochrome b subunit [Phycisphaerales bacterium]|nr:succinate dehydrogenase cytochrome b subunit [Phycisphaerales bacterium]